MAQKATICKVELSVADMDRDYYETHNLTVAKHPSETDERLMARILAFALNAHEQLEFTRGISKGICRNPEWRLRNCSAGIETSC